MPRTLSLRDERTPLVERPGRGSAIRVMALCALLASASALFTRFLSLQIPIGGVPALRIGLGSLPILLAGLLLGAGRGALVGAAADLLGMALFPTGPYLPIFTLSSALKGAMPAWILSLFRRGEGPRRLGPFVVAVVASQILVSMFLGSMLIARAYGLPAWPLILSRGLSTLIALPLHLLLLWSLLHRLPRLAPRR